MVASAARGARYLLSGFRLIMTPGMRRFVIVPAAINITIFSAMIYLAAHYLDQFIAGLIPEWLDWLEWIIWPLFAVTALIISYYTFTLVANLLASPFNDRLSERVASHLGASPAREGRGILGDVAESLAAEIQKWIYFAGLALLVVVFWLIPLTTPIAPLLWLALGAWMMAVEYLGYPLSNQAMEFRNQRRWIHERRALALGFGLATLGATMIPIVNFLVMPAAVAGATRLWAEQGER